MTEPLLSARGISMTFPGVKALDGVDFDVYPGEVHALIGENGAGKSTLVRILAGEIGDYDGEVRVGGEVRRFRGPREAIAAGIAEIPQELQLVSSLSAAENVFLGREPRNSVGLLDHQEMSRRCREELEAIGEGRIPPQRRIERLESAQRQLVAIARALSLDARLIIMDEPTASLGGEEAARLEALVRRLCERGVAVVYISHKLDEVRRLAARVTVLRDGKRIVSREAAGLDEDAMVRLMVGREIPRVELAPLPEGAPEALRVEGLSVADPNSPEGYRVRDVSLTVRRGEIVGLAGLIGAGRTELLLALTGALENAVTGRVRVGARDGIPAHPAAAREAGLVLLPEERKSQAIFPDLSVAENTIMGELSRVGSAGFVSRRRAAEASSRLMKDTGVRAASGAVPIGTLSGGNQQKAGLARCLFASPTVLLLDEPTRGIDLAAKAEIYALLRRLSAEGFGIVLCSSEMSEILTQCHRVVVFREGRVAAELTHAEATEEKVLAAAAPVGAAERGDKSKAGGGGPPGSGSKRRRGGLARFTGLFGLAAVLALSIVFSPVRGGRPVFLDIGNLTDILRQVAEKGILAVGMTAVVISGGIDLSVGSVLALAATMTAWLLMKGGLSFVATAALVLLCGALWGAVNGFVVARWKLQPFIATLATMRAARGVARYLSGGMAIPLGFGRGGAPESVHAVAGTLLPYVPVPAVLFLA